MRIIQQFSTKNDCYKSNLNKVDSRYTNFQTTGPKGLMLHSVGCPQPKAQVFANLWNQPGKQVAVHAVLQSDGTVIQCLPWNYRGWHAGGSANNTHIGVEMTEPDCIKYTSGSSFSCSDKTRAVEQVKGTYNTAVELFAELCKKYNLNPLVDIISHREGSLRGVASNHGDPEHLWKQLGLNYTMDTFRADVNVKLNNLPTTNNSTVVSSKYLVQVTASVLNIRKGPGTSYAITGQIKDKGTYTIVDEKNGWGKLKSGAGWISLAYTKR